MSSRVVSSRTRAILAPTRVVLSATFPSALAVNPSSTMMALARRTADRCLVQT